MSSIGDRTVGVQLIESPVDRPQTNVSNQTAAVPSLCVLVPSTQLRGLDPESNSDKVDKRVQQPRDGNRAGIRPGVGAA